MLLSRRVMLLSGCAFAAGCGGGGGGSPPAPPTSPAPPPPPPPPPPTVRVAYDFSTGFNAFNANYAEYTPGQELGPNGIVFTAVGIRLPPPLANRSGIQISGTNRSDDLFMYIWRVIDGFVPGQRYRVQVDTLIATNVPRGCAGIGGSPGESVFVKAGASPGEPIKIERSGLVVTNLDKGGQAFSGAQLITVGTFAGGGGTCNAGQYALKTLSTAAPEAIPGVPAGQAPVVAANALGQLWLVIGTDSGFEGRTEIFYLEAAATFTPV